MTHLLHDQEHLGPDTFKFYCDALDFLSQCGKPFLVGGAYALCRYTGIVRDTKDLDVFVRPQDCAAILNAFAEEGYQAELTFPHWLGKVYRGENILDIIFSSGNAVATVDDDWFKHASEGMVLGRKVLLSPPEEIIWSKAFIMERERFDGADINHMLRACGETINWPRLLRRFGPHWRLLLSHLILFEYVYPAERGKIPQDVVQHLLDRVQQERAGELPPASVCHGTLLSRAQYLIDVEKWGYQDARITPTGKMSAEEVAVWTASIGVDNPSLGK